MALTETYLRNLKVASKARKISDRDGLSILIKPNGSKLWQHRYIYLGKEKTFSLGKYPLVSLQEARELSLAARKLLQEGLDPSAERKKKRMLERFSVNNTFADVAEEWFNNNQSRWTARHAQRLWRRVEIHILPDLGKRPISDITTLELLNTLRMIEKRGNTETSHRALQTCRLIFRFAVLSQKINYNPAIDLQGVLMAHKANNYPTIKQSELPSFLDKLETHNISQLNRLAIKFLMLTMVRQGEMRQAKWADIDFKTKEWRVRSETTKMRAEHRVPLSAQAIAALKEIRNITGDKEYIFASQQPRKNPYMSENTINKVLHGMGYKGALVAHGFRSLASTILNEVGQFNPDAIERQLAHMPRDKVRAAYNRAEYMEERVKMMQWWAGYVDGAKANIYIADDLPVRSKIRASSGVFLEGNLPKASEANMESGTIFSCYTLEPGSMVNNGEVLIVGEKDLASKSRNITKPRADDPTLIIVPETQREAIFLLMSGMVKSSEISEETPTLKLNADASNLDDVLTWLRDNNLLLSVQASAKHEAQIADIQGVCEKI